MPSSNLELEEASRDGLGLAMSCMDESKVCKATKNDSMSEKNCAKVKKVTVGSAGRGVGPSCTRDAWDLVLLLLH